jgi:hypothetical protein
MHFSSRSILSLLLPFIALASYAQCTPVHLTAEQDHQRMMNLLHIQSLRAGPSGTAGAPNAANYDEDKAGPFSKAPDALTLNNGKRVTSAKMWWKQRRPQIVEAFDEDVLGRAPKELPAVQWEVVSTTNEKNGDVPIVTKKLVGHVDNSACPAIEVEIQVTLSTPANATGPVPVIMELDFPPEFMAQMAKRFPNMPKPTGPTWQQQVLAKGWGYASYIPTSVQADNGAGLTEGIIGLVNKGQPRSVDDWGALRAWAWGASRALDYFETDKAVDAKHVGITGHSRYGKASLVIMAYDPRFAIGYISSSGEGGAKLYRHIFGEQVDRPVRAASCLYQRRSHTGRRLGGCEGDVSGRGGRRSGLPVAWSAGFGCHRLYSDVNRTYQRRAWLPAARRRTYAHAELAVLYRVGNAMAPITAA